MTRQSDHQVTRPVLPGADQHLVFRFTGWLLRKQISRKGAKGKRPG